MFVFVPTYSYTRCTPTYICQSYRVHYQPTKTLLFRSQSGESFNANAFNIMNKALCKCVLSLRHRIHKRVLRDDLMQGTTKWELSEALHVKINAP